MYRYRISQAKLAISLVALLTLIAAGQVSAAQQPAKTNGGIGPGGFEEAFRNVPTADRPWVYWWWLKGNVSEQSITHDLEAMKNNGIGGLLMFDARGYHEGHVVPPPSRMEFMSPEWRRMLKFAVTEAGRLGLEMSVNLSSCAGSLKGPWEVGDDAPKSLVWTSARRHGPQRFACDLRRPTGKQFWDVAVFAVRHETKTASPPAVAASAATELCENWQEVKPKLAETPAAVEAVDLTDKVDSNNRLVWDMPPGDWTVLRFGCMAMEGHEYDVDILDPKAVQGHFERMGRAILSDAGPLAGKALTHFYSVSWEGAAPTWTLGLDREFAKYRGYSIRSWLPVLAGFPLKGRDVSERFLADYYKTLGDCFMNNFYGTLHRLCGQAGLKWHSESGGPWDRKIQAFEQADQLAFLARTDMPQGEFWWPRRSLNRPAAMTAHIYGKRLAATEAFTHMVQHWSAYPAALKPRADAAFCDGINHFIWHTFTASPPELGQPGSEYFAGSHLNPNVTWWPQARPFLDYLARGQFMLRQGRFVADVCAYIGDKPYLHWDRGASWSERASLKLAKGYAYDLVNTEVLLGRLTVEDGDLALPDGMRYRLLVLDLEEEIAAPAVLRKIIALANAGATVVLGKRRPQRATGLTNYPACDDEVRRLATELWGGKLAQPSSRTVGLGKIIVGAGLDEVLLAKKILPDFDGSWDYNHRRADNTEIYFVSGNGSADCTFRVQGKEPELWDPTTGRNRDAILWRATMDGRTVVPLCLPGNGAVFVVFRKPAGDRHIASITTPEDGLEIKGRNEEGANIRLWQKGPWTIHTSRNESVRIGPAALPDPIPLNGPWTVRFEKGRGAPESIVLKELLSWDKHPDNGIKHFSGKATYLKTFELTEDQASQLIRLQLGEVKYIAQVRLNGKDMGVVWTDPWAVDLTGAAKPGRNQLEIDVVNLWVNRLIGDAALPAEKRLTKTNVSLVPGERTFKIYQGFSAKDPLLPSGLLGPVRLEFGRDHAVRF